ncbi:uncharacterized protein PG986_011086 [Apiospora aurea]|uniref:Uncharacterized protein n=1 Tax=Apiospora aurea TaxID=335848 RepID=A0ABR1Q482_9PEZI
MPSGNSLEFDASCHPRPYPDYFKPRKPNRNGTLPTWLYVRGHPQGRFEWDVKRTKPIVGGLGPEIELHHGTANDGFHELIHATERMEPSGQLTHLAAYTTEVNGCIAEFCLTLRGGRFCLLLCQDKFILKREKDSLENIQHVDKKGGISE